MEDLERQLLNYEAVGEFLEDLKEKFSRRDNKTLKVVELKKVKQESKTMEEFVQEFRRTVRESGYEERSLIKEFKRGMNGTIRRQKELLEV